MHDIAKFLQGFQRFQKESLCDNKALLEQLKQGQDPRVLMIACCDSRVDPALLTDSALGELFIVRNIANIVPPYEPDQRHHGVSSAIEYAVRHLEVDHVIVLGHRQCGGIRALLEGVGQRDEFLSDWVDILLPAKQLVESKYADEDKAVRERKAEQAGVLVSLNNLMTFPWVRQRVETEKLILHGWYFDLETGELFSYLPHTKSFEPLVTVCEG